MQILVMFCMFLCDAKHSAAPRLGQLQELLSVGIPAMTLGCTAPHTLGCGTGWSSAGNSVCPGSIPGLCTRGVCKMGISENWGFLIPEERAGSTEHLLVIVK